MSEGIRTDLLTKEYSNNVTALKEVSLSIDQGEFVALIGRSGEREEHAHEHPWRTGPPDIGDRLRSTASRWIMPTGSH